METAATRATNPSHFTFVAAALITAVISAAVVDAAEPVAVPLQATRFVSNGLTGPDAVSIATDRCVQRIEARSVEALASCKLVVLEARRMAAISAGVVAR